MKKLYSSSNRIFLEILEAKLKADGINCFIKNQFPPAAGEVPPAVAWPEIWVDSNHFENAKSILTTELETESAPHPPWQCPQCKEEVEGQFNICWNCSHVREKQPN